MNLNVEFRICTGLVIVPDMQTWDGSEVKRVFLAQVAISAFDHVEFILRRAVETAAAREWLGQASRSRSPGVA